MRLHPAALVALPLALLVATGCSAKSTDTTGATAADACASVAKLPLITPGKLTVGTDSPAYDPWFSKDDPSNGKGFESAVAYAVAEKLGLAKSDVTWVKVPFNNSYAPGPKKFDFDINQISITPARAKVVDFSTGYYSASQAVIVLNKTRGSKTGVAAASLADLKALKLGAQTGTTSLSAIRDEVKPTQDPVVFTNTNVAKQALLNGQVDAIVADLPTALYISGVEISGSSIVGQFKSHADDEFGMLFGKGNRLVGCVDKAVQVLKNDGTLAGLEKRWIPETVSVPVLK